MNLSDFCGLCERLDREGAQVEKAQYDGVAFGNWLVQVSIKGRPRRQVVWDGKERWLTVATQVPKRERRERFSQAELQQMPLMDGLFALQQIEADEWNEEWSTGEPEQLTIEHVVSRLQQ